MIVWVASYPRSGVTWFGRIFEAIYGQRLYETNLAASRVSTGMFDPRFEYNNANWHFVKTHDQDLAFSSHPAIHIIRDGRDAMVSHAHFKRTHDGDTRPWPQILKELVLSSDWTIHGVMWHKRPGTIAVVRFEDLIRQPLKVVRQAIGATGWPNSGADTVELPTFAELHAQSPADARRGIVGSYRDEMPSCLEELFWRHHGQTMEMLGYGR